MTTLLEKTAQKRKLRHKARRGVAFNTKALEALNKEFRAVVGKLNKVDEAVRKDAENLKFFVKEARSLARRRDYLTAATVLTNFHEQVSKIAQRFKTFNSSVSKKHYEFLLKQIRETDKTRLFGYDPEKEISLEVDDADDGLISEASLVADWWHNIFDRDARAMKALENRFGAPFLLKLKEETVDMVKETENFFKFLVEKFNELGSAWASRNVGSYQEIISQFLSDYSQYHKTFIKYYSTNISPFKEEQKKIDDAAKQDSEKEELGMAQTAPHPVWAPNTSATPQKSSPKLEVPIQSGPRSARHGEPDPFNTIREPSPSIKAPSFPDPENFQEAVPRAQKIPPGPPTLRSPINPPRVFRNDLDRIMGDKFLGEKFKSTYKEPTKANQNFINGLEKLSSTQEILSEIIDYSEQLDEEGRSEESLKLLAIAEGLIKKEAGGRMFDWDHKKKDQNKPVKVEELDPLLEAPEKIHPVNHRLPQGHGIHQKWSSFPFLAKIGPSQIRVSSGAAEHLTKLVAKSIHHKIKDLDFNDLEIGFEDKLIQKIKEAIPRGILFSNMVCGEGANPKDCYLDIFTYIKLNEVDPSLKGVCKFVIVCRLDTFNGSVSVGTIRNIEIV